MSAIDVWRESRIREQLASGGVPCHTFVDALRRVSEMELEVWLNQAFGLGELPEDGLDLPRGCVPYLPCPVGVVLRMVELAKVSSNDIFVDIGAGLGRVVALTHLVTGATSLGIEVQKDLATEARELIRRLGLKGCRITSADAAELPEDMATGTVFFLYCPFSGERLERVLRELEHQARGRTIRVCTVDLPLPPSPWLRPIEVTGDLSVYSSGTVESTEHPIATP